MRQSSDRCIFVMGIPIPVLSLTGSCLNIKTPSNKYRNSHYKNKTVWWPSYLYNGNPHTWEDGLFILRRDPGSWPKHPSPHTSPGSLPCKHALTGPEWGRCQSHRPGSGPVKARYGMFTGYLSELVLVWTWPTASCNHQWSWQKHKCFQNIGTWYIIEE